MNKNYRTVYCETTNTWVAVSEIAKSKTKSNSVSTVKNTIFAGLIGLTTLALSPQAQAQVAAPEKINGTMKEVGTDIECFYDTESYSVICGDANTTANKTADDKQAKAVVMGYKATATGESNVALGAGSSASHTSGISIGSASKAHNNQTIAIGERATAIGETDIAIGKAAGENTVSTGRNIMIGESALKDATAANNVVAIGTGAGGGGGGTHTVAIGTLANNYSIKSPVTTNNNVALGYKAYASGGSAVAAGHGAMAEGSQAVAIGLNSNSSGNYTIAIGRQSVANTANALSIGNRSNSTGVNSIAFGTLAQATNTDAIAIGTQSNYQLDGNGLVAGSKKVGANSIAIGTNSNAQGEHSISIGSVKTSNINDTTSNTNTKGAFAIALGYGSNSNEKSSMAIGKGAKATKAHGIALGADSTTENTNIQEGYTPDFAINGDADSIRATKANTAGLSIGGQVTDMANAPNTLNGENVIRRQIHHVAAGKEDTDAVNVSQLKAVAKKAASPITFSTNNGTVTPTLGESVDFSGGLVDGGSNKNIRTTAENGKLNILFSESPVFGGITINNQGRISGVANPVEENDVVNKAYFDANLPSVESENQTVKVVKKGNIYDLAVDTSNLSLADGSNTLFKYQGDEGAGENNLSQSVRFVGKQGQTKTKVENGSVTVELDDNVVNSIAQNTQKAEENAQKITVNEQKLQEHNQDIQLNKENIAKGLNFSGDSGQFKRELGDTVKIAGDNNITTNAIDGTINVSLNKNLNLGDNGSILMGNTNINSNGLSVGEVNISNNGINSGNKQITNVASGGELSENNTNAANMSDLFKVANRAAANVNGGENITVETIINNDGSKTFNVSTKKEVAFDKVTTGKTEISDNGLKVGEVTVQSDGINLANNKITGLAKGVEDSDAVNVKQLRDELATAKTNVKEGRNTKVLENKEQNGTTSYTVDVKDDINLTSVTTGKTVMNDNGISVGDVKLSDTGLNAAGTKITNLEDGAVNADSKEAVNGSQLHATNLKVDENAAKIKENSDKINEGLNIATDNGEGNAKLGSKLSFTGDKNITTKFENGTVTTSLNDDLNVTSVTTGKSVMNDNGVSVGDVKLTDTGLNAAGTKVINLQNGEISATSKDAVTGSQIHQNNSAIASSLGTTLNNDGSFVQPTYTINGSQFNNVASALSEVNTTINKPLSYQTDKGSVTQKLGDTVTFIGGADSAKLTNNNIGVIVENDKVAVKLSEKLDGLKEVNTQQLNVENGLTVKEGATINMGNNVISNVAEGKAPNDVVTVNQLNNTIGTLGHNVGKIHQKIDDVDFDGRAGVAQAIATAGLGQAYLPGKSAVSIGGGYYRGQQGYAIGVSSISDNGKWIIKGSASGSSRGHFGGSTSVTYQW